MENKDSLKHIDKKYQASFKDQDPREVSGWNSPSDDVWDNISNRLDEDDDKGFAFWKILGVLLLLLITSLGIYYINQSNIGKGIESTSKTEQDVIEIQTATDSILNNNQVNIEESKTSSSQSNYANNASDISEQNKELGKLNSLIISTRNNPINSAETQSKKEIADLNKINSTSANFINPINEHLANSDKTIERITGANIRQILTSDLPSDYKVELSSFSEKQLISEQTSVPDPLETEKKKLNINYGLQVGALIPKFETERVYTQSLQPFNFSYDNNWSPEIGFYSSINISNRLSFQTGLLYNQHNYTATHNSPIQYQTDQEVAQNNNFVYQTPSTFATGLGTVEAEVNLSRASNSLAPGNTDLLLDVDMNQRLQYLAVPLQPSYHFAKSGQYQMAIKPTVQFNFLIDQQTEVSGLQTNHDIIHDNGTSINRDIEGLNSVVTNSGIALEISTDQFIENYNLGIEPYYLFNNGSINSSNPLVDQKGIVGIKLSIGTN